MSGDEMAVLMVSGVLAAVFWIRWYWLALAPPAMVAPSSQRLPMCLPPVFAAALLMLVLLTVSADDVRNDPQYIVLYTLLGAAWVGLAVRLFPLVGLSPRQDVVERRNAAAGPAVWGGIIGVTLCFAGGNIGNGPGWWVVVFCAALATGGLLACWWAVNALAGDTEQVTIDRDRAAGVRLGAFLAGVGLILGRSVAGDWHSAGATVADFLAQGWPVVVMVGLEALAAKLGRPTAERPAAPVGSLGVFPAFIHLCVAVICTVSLGSWA